MSWFYQLPLAERREKFLALAKKVAGDLESQRDQQERAAEQIFLCRLAEKKRG